jgi:Ca2+-binding EF-hand superfamily protein
MFVKKCLSYNANERPTADEALNLAWMQKDFDNLAPELDSMDMVQAALQNFASYGTLKKLALMVIAHKSTSEEIGFLRKLFTKYDTLKNGVITLPEFKAALVDYDYTEIEMEDMFAGIDVDGTGEVKYSEFLAATIEAHGGIDEERLAEAFDRIDCDDSGYITVNNLATILGDDVPKEYLASIIEEADIKKDKRISYAEFQALWDEGEDVKRKQTLEDVKRRRLLHTNSIMSAVGSVASFLTDRDEVMSDISATSDEAISGGFLFRKEKAKSIRMFADI